MKSAGMKRVYLKMMSHSNIPKQAYLYKHLVQGHTHLLATKQTIWKEIGADVVETRQWKSTVPLHVVYRFEIEHLLKRVGFEVEHVYGDFNQQELQDGSPHMIWFARKPYENL
jgi:hypothetical protein